MITSATALDATPRPKPKARKTWLVWACPKCSFVFNKDGSGVEALSVTHRCPKTHDTVRLRPVKD